MIFNVNIISENTTKLWDHYVTSPVIQNDLSVNTLLLGGITCLVFLTTAFYAQRSSNVVPYKYGLPIVGSWSFFTNRYRFLQDGMKTLGGKFKFSILKVSYYSQLLERLLRII